MVHLLGDSHVYVCDNIPGYSCECFRDGPETPTAYNLIRNHFGSQLLRSIHHLERNDNFIIISAGEVDCRIHIYLKYNQLLGSISELIDSTIRSYMRFLELIKETHIPYAVLGIPPCGYQDDNRYGFPVYADRKERISIYREFNSRMKSICVNYIDVYSKTVNSLGLISDEWLEDEEFTRKYGAHGTHLNNKAGQFVKEYIESLPKKKFSARMVQSYFAETLSHKYVDNRMQLV